MRSEVICDVRPNYLEDSVIGLGGKETVTLRFVADKRAVYPSIGNSCIRNVKTHFDVIHSTATAVLPITKGSVVALTGCGGAVLRSPRISRNGEKYMNNADATGVSEVPGERKISDRRSFLRRASLMGAAVGATGLVGFDNLMTLAAAQPKFRRPEGNEAGVEKGD